MFSAWSWISRRCHFGYLPIIALFRGTPPSQSVYPVSMVVWRDRWNALEISLSSRLGLSSLTSRLTWAFWLVWILLCILTGKSKGGKEICFQSSFLLDRHNERWRSQGFLLAMNLLLRPCLVICQNYFAPVCFLFFLWHICRVVSDD